MRGILDAMKIPIILAAVIGLAAAPTLGTFGRAAQEERGGLSARDFQFLKKAFADGMSQIQMGDLAEQKAISQSVRDCGGRMVKDHKKANDQLRNIASKNGAVLPYSEASAANHLQKLAGPNFDKTYASATASG